MSDPLTGVAERLEIKYKSVEKARAEGAAAERARVLAIIDGRADALVVGKTAIRQIALNLMRAEIERGGELSDPRRGVTVNSHVPGELMDLISQARADAFAEVEKAIEVERIDSSGQRYYWKEVCEALDRLRARLAAKGQR